VTIKDIEKYYRTNKESAEKIKSIIHKYAEKIRKERKIEKIKIMNFCGTHEWTTVHFGIRTLMPPQVELIAGPGCPVCITPSIYIEESIKLALDGVTVYVFGDAYKLPAVRRIKGANSLFEAKSIGGKVKVVYSFLDAIEDAKKNKEESVFLGIGFETTAPSYSIPIEKNIVPENLKFISTLRLTPPAAEYAIQIAQKMGLTPIQGIIAPGHVSAVIGAKPWTILSKKYGIPSVVSGFEPIDLLLSIALILRMIYRGKAETLIEYKRVVSWEGNIHAQKSMRNVFEVIDAGWRGIGMIPSSGLRLKEKYKKIDAVEDYNLAIREEKDGKDLPPGCLCAHITLGLAKPTDCPLFMKACKPSKPYGPCMVSSEGTCAIWARFGGGGLVEDIAKSIGLEV